MRAAVIIVLVALVAACATGPECRLPPIPQPVHPWLWTVRGPHGAIVLFGTHQAAGRDDVPAAAQALLKRSDIVLVEALEGGSLDNYDDSPDARYYLQRPAVMPSLMKTLSNQDFADLKGRLDVSAQELAKMRPWVALSLLMRTAVTFPDPNMPTVIRGLARRHEIQMDAFDTWQQQTVFLDMITDTSNVVSALHTQDLSCAFDADVVRYRSGLEAAYTGPTASNASTENPNRQVALAERQRVWTEKLAYYLESGEKAFVAIGVQNIIGEDGVLRTLAARGYVVERIDPLQWLASSSGSVKKRP